MRTQYLPEPARRARRVPLGLAALALLLALGAAPLSAIKPLKEVDVHCTAGDSVNDALTRHPDHELAINIQGLCVEDVVVRRDYVTLRGVDPAADGIQAATVDDPFGSTLLIRGCRLVTVENLQLVGGKHAGLAIEDSRRNVILRNLRIEGNQEVGLRVANSLAVGFDLAITGNGLAGVGLSETAYLRCDDCIIADNPSPGLGFGIMGSAGALATIHRGTIAAQFPIAFRFNSVAELDATSVSGYVALNASDSAIIKAKNSTLDGSLRADGDSQIELRNSRQVFNPAPGGNVVSGASQMSTDGGTVLLGETAFDEFSSGLFGGATSLETLACFSGSDAVCEPGVTMTSSSCPSCP